MHEGVLDDVYAKDRRRKLHLIFRYKVRARIVAQAAHRYLGRRGPFRILDFGSAEGLGLLELRDLLPDGRYTGIEYSDELLSCVSGLPSDTRIIKGDVTALPDDIKMERYDIVSALALLEHLPEPIQAVREAASVLRPGGIFVATSPNSQWDIVANRLGLGLPQEKYHISAIDKDRMIHYVRSAGMELLAYERFMWAPIAFLPYLKIPVSPCFSTALDNFIRAIKIFDWLFINQCIIARKPL